jgi:hypothetical protein
MGPRLRRPLFLVCFNPTLLFEYRLRALPGVPAFVVLFSLFILIYLLPAATRKKENTHYVGKDLRRTYRWTGNAVFFSCFRCLILREYWMITEDQAFLRSYIWLLARPLPPPTSRDQVVFLSQSSCESLVELTDGRGWRGWARSQMQDREGDRSPVMTWGHVFYGGEGGRSNLATGTKDKGFFTKGPSEGGWWVGGRGEVTFFTAGSRGAL